MRRLQINKVRISSDFFIIFALCCHISFRFSLTITVKGGWPVSRDPEFKTPNLPNRRVRIVTRNPLNEPKPDLCGLQPVDRNTEMETNLWTRTQLQRGLKGPVSNSI